MLYFKLYDIVPDIVYHDDIVYDIIFEDKKLMMLLVQDCVCAVAPYPFRIEPLEDFNPIGDLDVTGGAVEGVMFGMRGPFFSLLVPYVQLGIWAIKHHTRMFRWSSSTPLSTSV